VLDPASGSRGLDSKEVKHLEVSQVGSPRISVVGHGRWHHGRVPSLCGRASGCTWVRIPLSPPKFVLCFQRFTRFIDDPRAMCSKLVLVSAENHAGVTVNFLTFYRESNQFLNQLSPARKFSGLRRHESFRGQQENSFSGPAGQQFRRADPTDISQFLARVVVAAAARLKSADAPAMSSRI
jgi:hypothetical protein